MNSKKQAYFIGVGGIGMSALARYYKSQNWSISGSDLQDSKLLKELRKEGIRVRIDHKKGNLPQKTDLVIYNQAIPENNPELKEAQKRGIPLLSYPEAVGELTKQYKTIAIAGAHGKSTTTAMVSLILINAGFDPMVIIGTHMREFGFENHLSIQRSSNQQVNSSNFRLGKGWFVLEADEYGRAFHHYSPYAAVITNIDKEHLDTYKNLVGVKKSFLQFISNIQDGGVLVLNEADKNLKSLEANIKKIGRYKNLNIYWYGQNQHIAGLVSLGLSPALIGAHNISNATGAYTLTKALGVDNKIIYDTIKNFSGTSRRLEFRGLCQLRRLGRSPDLGASGLSDVSSDALVGAPILGHRGCQMSVYDDYAHHPTEIRASLAALKHEITRIKEQDINRTNSFLADEQHSNILKNVGMLPHEEMRGGISDESVLDLYPVRVVCVFQPHQTERLALLFKDFVDAFKDADVLILLDVYKVPGRERELRMKNKELRLATSKNLAIAILKKYPDKPVIYLKNPKLLLKVLQKLNSKFSIHDSIVVLMGAGDIVKWTDYLLRNK